MIDEPLIAPIYSSKQEQFHKGDMLVALCHVDYIRAAGAPEKLQGQGQSTEPQHAEVRAAIF